MSIIDTATVSVVIPVKNEVKKIRDCINGLLSQTVKVKEIIVVDSGSTDGTLEILKEYEIVKVIEIPGAQFNHGATRNLGVDAATGEYVLLTVGDAKAVDEFVIENMLKVFEQDKNVAGVCGLQVVPHDKDKNPAEWFRPVSKPQITKYNYTVEAYHALSPMQKRNVCGWDDVIALYKRDLKQKIPFRFTSYAEDAQWAQDAILAGHTIAYNPAARVYHYHLEDAEFSFKKNYTVMYHMYKFFGLIYDKPKPNWKTYASLANSIWKAEGLSLSEKIKWWNYNLALMSGNRKAADVVHDHLSKGDAYFEEQHQLLCGKPPIPVK